MPLRQATDARMGAGLHGRAMNLCPAEMLFCRPSSFACSICKRRGFLPTWQEPERSEKPAYRQVAAPCQMFRVAYPGRMSSPSDESVTYLAQADYRDDRRIFGIRQEDRFSHVYIIGKTGTGKSTLMEKMALQDLECGRGFALIDPHGDLVERVAERAVSSRGADVIYLNTS